MNIAIDVMGGDYAPEAVIDGIIESVSLLANKETILAIGPEDVINSLFKSRNFSSSQVRIIHADQVSSILGKCVGK
jgi:glycerol-3-phosphate acyltransferase PlsX